MNRRDFVASRRAIEHGLASYISPNRAVHAQYEQCTDLHAGVAITAS